MIKVEGEEYKPRRVKKMTPLCYAKLIKALQEDDYDNHELAELIGLHLNTVSEYTRCLHKEKAIHVCGWNKDRRGRDVTPIFRMGEGRDKKRQRFTPAQIAARYRARKKAKGLNTIFKMAA